MANNQSAQEEQWCRQTLEWLARDQLTPTPENYSLLFHYFSGSNPNLTLAMNTLLQQSKTLNQSQCSDLYRLHLSLESEQKLLKETSDAIDNELRRVLETIDATATGTNKFGKTLDSFSGELTNTASLEQIRVTVTKVIDETRNMAKQNQRLQIQLEAATQQVTEMRYNLERAHKESQIDPLTEIGNRKFFDREMARAISEATENQVPLTLLMIDIDHFKKFNDTHGHLVGDQVLRLVARTLVENLKGRDVIARYGGEEFVILLPQTRVGDAEKVANHLRASLGTKQIKRRSTNESLGVVTISVGATEYQTGEDTDNFIGRADSALYKAKQTGRNKVVSEV